MIAKIVDGTRLFIIEDEGIVYAHGQQEIFALNTTATYLWCLIEEGRGKDDILRDYGATFGVTQEIAAGQMAAVLENFCDMGLVDLPNRAAPSPPFASKPVIDDTPPYKMPPLGDGFIAAERYYKLLETTFLVRYSDLAQLHWVDPVLRNFASPGGGDGAVVVDLRHDENEIFLYRDGRGVGKCGALEELAPLVKGCLWLPSIDAFDYFLNLHTGVLAHGQGCILLPAAAGSGKSTTTAALVHHGFPYLSDEVALLTQDCSVRPLPLALCFKDTGWDVVSRYFDDLDDLPAHLRADGKIVKYLSLPAQQCADPARSYPVKAIVFPCYSSGAATSFAPLSKTQALDRMFRECVSIPGDFSAATVSRLVDWIKGVPCHSLEFSDLDAAVAAIRDHLDE